ncbi:MAG: Sec-independent protein translocase protein TatB [Thiogranum sp.]
MFDIGFWELTVIGVVALLVIGPERLPRVARTAGMWVGRARRFVSSVKADIDRELAAEELKKTLNRQAGSKSVYEILDDTRESPNPEAAPPTGGRSGGGSDEPGKSHDANG